MKIYTKIVIDIITLKTKHAESFEYGGPVAQCKGSSTTTNTQDPIYNAGLLAIQEDQQGMADKLFNMTMYGVEYDPTASEKGLTIDGKWYSEAQLKGDSNLASQYMQKNPAYAAYMAKSEKMARKGMSQDKIEKKLGGPAPEEYVSKGELESRLMSDIYGYDDNAITSEIEYYQNVINSNQQLLGKQTEAELANLGLTMESIAAQRQLLPVQTQTELAQLEDTQAAISARAPIRQAYANAVMEPVDTARKMNEAQAGVQHSYDLTGKEFERKMFTSGVDPSNPGYATAINSRNLSVSKDIAAARTQAKQDAEDTQFDRLQSAMTTGF